MKVSRSNSKDEKFWREYSEEEVISAKVVVEHCRCRYCCCCPKVNLLHYHLLQSPLRWIKDLVGSMEVVFSHRITWLLICGPFALIGSETKVFGESTCFALAGLALIPFAERLSFVTEEVAAHTNGTVGALLNATFGNAPELLISAAALRQGFYRVVRLTLLGSILTNLLFVWGVSCFVGGLRHKVLSLQTISGNVPVGMLLLGTAGIVLPSIIVTGDGDYNYNYNYNSLSNNDDNINNSININIINNNNKDKEEEALDVLYYSRINSLIMLVMYVAYLIFQLATHHDEFDNEQNQNNQINQHNQHEHEHEGKHDEEEELEGVPMIPRRTRISIANGESYHQTITDFTDNNQDIEMTIHSHSQSHSHSHIDPQSMLQRRHSFPKANTNNTDNTDNTENFIENNDDEDIPFIESMATTTRTATATVTTTQKEEHISFSAGVFWLFTITLCISSMSAILVDTIDGFASKSHTSEIFASVVILPFFSNIAEQVSAVIFAYRNKMDLCVGVTTGSATQILLCILPGSVLIGWCMGRSMSLNFLRYEQICLLVAVSSVAVVLQGGGRAGAGSSSKGTTNWLAGLFHIGVYLIIAAGFWFHEDDEDLSHDEEPIYTNRTLLR